MYLTLNAPDLARPLFRAIAPHLSEKLERHWRLPSKRTGGDLPAEVWLRIEAMEQEERRQKRLHNLSQLEFDAIRALRTRQWFGLQDLFARKGVKGVLVWNGHRGRRGLLVEAAKSAGLPIVFFERCAFSGYVQAELDGVNAGGRALASDAFRRHSSDPSIIDWFRTSQRQRRGPNPFAAESKPTETLPKRFIYCPLQVAADTQLSVYGGWVGDMPAFMTALVKAADSLPSDARLVLRPHPSCRVGQETALRLALTNPRVRVIEGGTSAELLKRCDAVATVNSSVGLEAFGHGKPVLTFGQAFYARPGLTTQINDADSLRTAFADLDGLSFDADLRVQFLTWLRDEGFQRWPRHSRDGEAKALAAHVDRLIRA